MHQGLHVGHQPLHGGAPQTSSARVTAGAGHVAQYKPRFTLITTFSPLR